MVLIWGICRMMRLVGSLNTMLANKVTIIMHIVAFMVIIFTNALQNMSYFGNSSIYEIATICNMVVYFFCTLIFGLILNTIVTKIVSATNFDESISPSLIGTETGSVVDDLSANEVHSSVNSFNEIEI